MTLPCWPQKQVTPVGLGLSKSTALTFGLIAGVLIGGGWLLNSSSTAPVEDNDVPLSKDMPSETKPVNLATKRQREPAQVIREPTDLQCHAAKPARRAEEPAPLPQEWEQRSDPESGRIYYVNHFTEETQWERPSTSKFLLINLKNYNAIKDLKLNFRFAIKTVADAKVAEKSAKQALEKAKKAAKAANAAKKAVKSADGEAAKKAAVDTKTAADEVSKKATADVKKSCC